MPDCKSPKRLSSSYRSQALHQRIQLSLYSNLRITLSASTLGYRPPPTLEIQSLRPKSFPIRTRSMQPSAWPRQLKSRPYSWLSSARLHPRRLHPPKPRQHRNGTCLRLKPCPPTASTSHQTQYAQRHSAGVTAKSSTPSLRSNKERLCKSLFGHQLSAGPLVPPEQHFLPGQSVLSCPLLPSSARHDYHPGEAVYREALEPPATRRVILPTAAGLGDGSPLAITKFDQSWVRGR
ncbi:hypothetical protein SAMN05216593_11380 [Pseudomonas asturiensis]|uniref:Uncharacterized protein n=1 Tax=Pseudomonas asturiensis TaxID=1190415 RepID=A0A1M7PTM1_9PSED|nr:hypothetical protein SAMN05216593_11380 [Pseudomonas asturiensis]